MWLYLSGSDPSPTAKSTPTVRECCSHECQWVKLKEPQSGTILGLLMGKRSGGSLILSTEGFRARTSVLQDAEKAWQESEADYIGRSTGYVWRSAQGSYFSKTYQLSLFEEEQPSWTRLPRSGMTVDGQCYRLKRWARRIRERGGFCLPTPRAVGTGNLSEKRKDDQFPNLETVLSRMLLPTPQSCDATKGPAKEYDPKGKQSSQRNLVTLAARLPTPRAHDAQDAGTAPSEARRNPPSIPCIVVQATGKKLNPRFVEWMMQYPIGWTELEPWVMQSCLFKRKKRSKS